MKHAHHLRSGRSILGASCLTLAACLGNLRVHGQAIIHPPQINGTNAIIQWESAVPAGALQIAPAVGGPWTTIQDTSAFVSNRVTTPLGLPARFFRVVNNGVPGPSLPVLPAGLPESPEITFASVQRLAVPTGGADTRLAMRFAPGTIPVTFSNVVPVLAESGVTLLQDNGQGVDQVANDGLFSAAINVSLTELEAANARLAAQPPSRQFTQQFVDRRRVGSTNIPLSGFPLAAFTAGQAITLLATNLFGPAKFNCPAGSPLAYDWRKTMMITDLPVVADPSRTWEPCPWPAGAAGNTKLGKWTFGRLMTDMANFAATGIKPGVFAREWLRSWEFNQTINSFSVPAVPAIKTKLVNNWVAQSLANGFPAGELDLSIAPFRLCAIVNRLDLRPNPGFSYGSSGGACNAGEGRFVFCAVSPDANCSDLRFLVIFEYGIPKCGCSATKAWANQWAALNTITPQSAYNAALEAITDQFAGPNTDPSKLPNMSALNQIRSNEILDNNTWVMREWTITPPSGMFPGFLQEVTVKNTPDISFDNTATINAFLPAGLAPTTVPKLFLGNPFLGGSAPMPVSSAASYFVWDGNPTMANAPLLGSPAVPIRHLFALNTCNGCHLSETKAINPSGQLPTPLGIGTFTHVECRPSPSTFQPALLSDFLTGLNMPKRDPLNPAITYTFADLDRRVIDLDELINCPCRPFGLIFNPIKIGKVKFVH